MAQVMVTESKLEALADAIRGRSGSNEKMTLDRMADAVAGIHGDDDAILERTVSGRYFNPRITALGKYAFAYCSELTEIDLPNLLTPEQFMFGWTGITKATFFFTTGAHSMFVGCSKLKEVNLPNLTALLGNTFQQCSSLENVNLPAMQSCGADTFYMCTSLKEITLPSMKTMGMNSFRRCFALTKVILPNDDVVCSMTSDAFTEAYHYKGTVNATYNPDGLTDGYIYVPDALVDTYKAATNWTVYADQIKPLSELEA